MTRLQVALHGHAEIIISSAASAPAAAHLPDNGLVGQQLFAGEATRLAYGTAEAKEGRDAFLEKSPQDYGQFPWHL